MKSINDRIPVTINGKKEETKESYAEVNSSFGTFPQIEPMNTPTSKEKSQ